MSVAPTHIVNRYGLSLDFASRQEARWVTDALQETCRLSVASIIDEACSAVVQADDYVTIPYLEIDLGELDLRNISEDFLQKLRSALKDRLQAVIAELPTKSPLERAAEVIVHYGETGQYPWWAGAPTPALLTDAVQRMADASVPPAQLRVCLCAGDTLRRLAVALPDKLLVTLWERLADDQPLHLAQPTIFAATKAILMHPERLARAQWQRFWSDTMQRLVHPEAVAPRAASIQMWLLSVADVPIPSSIWNRIERIDSFLHVIHWLREVCGIPAVVMTKHLQFLANSSLVADSKSASKFAQHRAVLQNWLQEKWQLGSRVSGEFVQGFELAYRLGDQLNRATESPSTAHQQVLAKQGKAATHSANSLDSKMQLDGAEFPNEQQLAAIFQQFQKTHPAAEVDPSELSRWVAHQFSQQPAAFLQNLEAQLWQIAQSHTQIELAVRTLLPQLKAIFAEDSEPSLEKIESWAQSQGFALTSRQVEALHQALLLQEKSPSSKLKRSAATPRGDLLEGEFPEVYFAKTEGSPKSLSPAALDAFLETFRADCPDAELTLETVMDWLQHRQATWTMDDRQYLAAAMVDRHIALAKPSDDHAFVSSSEVIRKIDAEIFLQGFLGDQGRENLNLASIESWLTQAHPTIENTARNAWAQAILALGEADGQGVPPLAALTPEALLARFQQLHPHARAEREALSTWVGKLLGIPKAQQGRLLDAMLLLAAQTESAARHPQLGLEELATSRRQARTRAADEAPIWVGNAGILLFWPFLQRLFQQLGLVVDKDFVSSQAQAQALRLLQHMVEPDAECNESALALPKILCGLRPDDLVDPHVELSSEMLEVKDLLIEVALAHWTMAGKMSADGFRQAWLWRQGSLRMRDDHWLLRVEGMAHDILLEGLPWEIAYIQLPWMPHVMYVDWGEKAKFNA